MALSSHLALPLLDFAVLTSSWCVLVTALTQCRKISNHISRKCRRLEQMRHVSSALLGPNHRWSVCSLKKKQTFKKQRLRSSLSWWAIVAFWPFFREQIVLLYLFSCFIRCCWCGVGEGKKKKTATGNWGATSRPCVRVNYVQVLQQHRDQFPFPFLKADL